MSEFMLQQTQVATVVPRYHAFLDRFPTVTALARAGEDDVLAAWSGLGYYRRARHLHACAKHIDGHGWPTGQAAWAKLPGIGAYMSGALASILDGEPVAAVDGNVVRVVARQLGEERPVAGAVKAHIAAIAQDWLDPQRPGDWNQALMDLGATICTPREPDCGGCPVRRTCAADAAGLQQDIPAKKPRAPRKIEHLRARISTRGDAVWLERRGPGLLEGTWAPPLEDAAAGPHDVEHVFTHRTWRVQVAAGPDQPPGDGRWVPLSELPQIGLSTAAKKILAASPQVQEAVP